MENNAEDRAALDVTFDAADLHRRVRDLESALNNPATYSRLVATASIMDRETFGRDILNGWCEALVNSQRGIVNLRLICAELESRQGSSRHPEAAHTSS